MLKKSLLYTVIIIAIATLVNLVTSPENIISAFQYGFWTGIGMLLTAIVIVFLIVLAFIFLTRIFDKSQNKRHLRLLLPTKPPYPTCLVPYSLPAQRPQRLLYRYL
ncbi:hypothetical protein [Paenibacillus peoriae]|uniref:hypothetical protein n=1 Tax=Paenibacillus peoriae TaxID=59893 RepID=UPI00026C60AF